MASPVSYCRAAQVAVVAVAADLYFNQGRTTSALLLGTLGNLGLEFCRRVALKMDEIEEREKIPKYRVVKYNGFDPTKNEASLQKALARLESDYPVEYRNYLQSNGLSSDAEVLAYFKKDLGKGCCYGVANALYDQIVRDRCPSMRESAPLLRNEDVFYQQILQSITTQPRFFDLAARLAIAEKHLKLAEAGKSIGTEAEWMRDTELFVNQLREWHDNVSRHDHLRNFTKSESFPIEALPAVYREQFEKTSSEFPDQQDFVGAIHLPKHVIGFQCGPKGYFLYDSFTREKGLFQYPDADTFFQELRSQVLYDVAEHKYTIVEKEKPDAQPEELRKDADELLKKVRPYYDIRPLGQINPKSLGASLR